MDRRKFLGIVLIGSALGLQACATDPEAVTSASRPTPSADPSPKPTPVPTPTTTPAPPPPEPAAQVFTPQFDLPGGPIWGLPDEVGNQFAWTVDDGSSSEVVAAYIRFAQETGTRLTFFINGMYPAWAEHAAALAPLIATGQVQIANHTYSHPSLTNISDAQIQADLMQNHEHIQQLFGIDARPWYRPPYGNRDARTDAAAAAVGYTQPVMWYGSLGDSGLITPEVMLQEADKWLLPAHIVLGHANAPTVTQLFGQLQDITASRGLTAVTLNDVFRT